MKNTFGDSVALTIYGESHGPAIGAVLDGIAAGVPVDEAYIAAQMDKRRARGDGLSTSRIEADRVEFLSGVYRGRTTGSPITIAIQNQNTRSGDYVKSSGLLRPGHADYTAHAKYGGWQDERGGGHFSGRVTAGLVAAGAICRWILQAKGVVIATHLRACAGVEDLPFAQDETTICKEQQKLNDLDFSVLSETAGAAMKIAIRAAAAEGDSVGGVLETAVTGLNAGLGEPFFDSVESKLSHLLFSIPAVKGVEFGDGFGFASLRGSAANDPFRLQGGRVVTATNHNGGINGGITSGMPVVFRTAVKPTPSIYKPQQTVDYAAKKEAGLQIAGRHDPCILPRARAVQDAAAALGLLDLYTQRFGTLWQAEGV